MSERGRKEPAPEHSRSPAPRRAPGGPTDEAASEPANELANGPANEPSKETRLLRSEDLLGSRQQIDILHNGERYVLSLTRLGKLILTK